jgi:hypothetical protein
MKTRIIKNSGLYIEVGRISQALEKQLGLRVRDKSIKVKFIYKGNDETFLQAISMLSISYIMKKIYNIIDSELILRTNNHRLRQEFGEVGIRKYFC